MSEEYVRKDVHEADINAANESISNLRDRLEDYKQQTSSQMNMLGIIVAVIAFIAAFLQIGIALLLWIVSN